MKHPYRTVTKKSYNDLAAHYGWRDDDIFDGKFQFQIKSSLRKFIKFLPKNANILDIGFGGGRDLYYLSKKGFRTIGIDNSKRMVTSAKKRYPKLTFKTMDAEEMSFKKGEFDGVWANASLHHIPKKHLPIVLKKINKILKQKGIFFIKVKKGISEGFDTSEKFGIPIKRYFTQWEKSKLSGLLKKSGFTILYQKTIITTGTQWLEMIARKK